MDHAYRSLNALLPTSRLRISCLHCPIIAPQLESRYLGEAWVVVVLGRCTVLVASCRYHGCAQRPTATAENSPFLSVLSYRGYWYALYCLRGARVLCPRIPPSRASRIPPSRASRIRVPCYLLWASVSLKTPLHQSRTCHRWGMTAQYCAWEGGGK